MALTTARVYPWNEAQWRATSAQLGRLPHALLLTGAPGLGKNAFALELARALLCGAPREAGQACGVCKGCQLYAAGNHPDFLHLVPAEEGKSILIDQVRGLLEFMTLKPHTAARKVAVVSPAEAMNVHAANSLLKILEEPPPGSHLILVVREPGLLPATVRSRCSQLAFRAPPRKGALAWLADQAVPAPAAELLLALADQAPLRAVALHAAGFIAQRNQFISDLDAIWLDKDDPAGCAGRWKKAGAESSLRWLQGFCADLIRLKATQGAPRLFNPDIAAELQARADRLHLDQLLSFYDTVSRNCGFIGESLDELLLLEEVLITWAKLHRQ